MNLSDFMQRSNYASPVISWVYPVLVSFFIAMAMTWLVANADSRHNLYETKVLRVIDGDTLEIEIDLWPGQTVQTKLRIDGVDTPEIRGKCENERELAQKAKVFTEHFVKKSQISHSFYTSGVKNGKYSGRVVGDILNISGESLSESLVKAGLARQYNGKEKRRSWCE